MIDRRAETGRGAWAGATVTGSPDEVARLRDTAPGADQAEVC
ncbi:MAG: hypothetical protein ACFCVK_18435 [Acidimicrobiales bacterium]